MKNILLISASPKKKGNSASIVNKLHACLNARVLFLCDYIILPCIDCGYCKIKTGECLQDSKEQNTAKTIFKEMQQADEIILLAQYIFIIYLVNLRLCLIGRKDIGIKEIMP